MDKEQLEKKFDNTCSQLSEHFDDYLVLVRVGDGVFVSRASDHCWAIGAAERYISNVKNDDGMELKEFRRDQERQ